MEINTNFGKYFFQSKIYTILVSLYITIFLTTILLSRQLIQYHSFLFAGATLTIPIGFFLGDVIAEIYGYYVARQLVFIFIICSFLFSLIMGLVYAPSPPFWTLQNAYILVLGHSLQISFASAAGIIIGGNVNAYTVSKWKILLNGRYFGMRSLGASSIGEFIFVLIALPLSQYNNAISLKDLLWMMALSYGSKLLFSLIIIIPGSIFMIFLKKIESPDSQLKFNSVIY